MTNNIAHDLFLLMSNLSQLKNKNLLLNVFTGAINSFNANFSITYQDAKQPVSDATGSENSADSGRIEIRTHNNSFGYLETRGQPEMVAPEFPILLQNAVQMLAVILENRLQERLLADENLALSDQVAEKTHSLHQSHDLLKIRLQLSEMAQQCSIDRLLQAALDEAEKLTGSSIGFFHFISEDQEEILLCAWSTNTLQHMCQAEGKGLHYPVSKAGVWADCLHTHQPVIYNDYAALLHRKGLPEGHAHLQRMISVPILRAGQVTAILGLGNKPTDYTQAEVEILQTLASVIVDLVERKQAEDRLHESERKLRLVFEILPVGVSILDAEGKIVYMNPALERILGTAREDLLQGRFRQRIYLRQDGSTMPPEEYASSRAKREQRTVNGVETGVVKEDLSVVWTSIDAIPVMFQDWNVLVVTSDISERRQAEQQVRTTLAEKEILLRELYHRTKNNMQTIYSLLSIQAAHITDPRAQAAFTATQNRILSMSLVHEKLYEEQNLSRISLSDYIKELARLLIHSYTTASNQVTLTVTVEEIYSLIDVALPCGLILNELITNALEHAFPNGRRGQINVCLQQANNYEIVLQVSDDGVGLPEGFDVGHASSLGMSTICALTRQLSGEVHFNGGPGVTCRVNFRNDLYEARV